MNSFTKPKKAGKDADACPLRAYGRSTFENLERELTSSLKVINREFSQEKSETKSGTRYLLL